MENKEQKIEYQNLVIRNEKFVALVVKKYEAFGKKIGLNLKQLKKAGKEGLLVGVQAYQDTIKTNKIDYKASAYLTWWIRRHIHILLAIKILKIGEKDANKGIKAILDLLEEE